MWCLEDGIFVRALLALEALANGRSRDRVHGCHPRFRRSILVHQRSGRRFVTQGQTCLSDFSSVFFKASKI